MDDGWREMGGWMEMGGKEKSRVGEKPESERETTPGLDLGI